MIVSIDVRAQVTYYYRFSFIGLGDLMRFEMIFKVMISDIRLVSILRG